MMSVGELEKFYHLSRQNIQSREQKDALIEQRELLEERIAELQEVLDVYKRQGASLWRSWRICGKFTWVNGKI